MLNIIVAVSKQSNGKLGIGLSNSLSWSCTEELKLFKQKTLNNTVIFGRNTLQFIPKVLKNRNIYCISKSLLYKDTTQVIGNNTARVYTDLLDVIRDSKERFPQSKIFIAGGEQIYNLVFSNYKNLISEVHISFMNKEYDCDKFFPQLCYKNSLCLSHQKFDQFTHYILDIHSKNTEESNYLELLKYTLYSELRKTRNANVYSSFSPPTLKFNLEKNTIPLLTTKKMFFRGVVEELLFFIRGETNTKILEQKDINIWKGNTSSEFLKSRNLDYEEGEMGPMYGYQWRNFNGELDQLQKLINQIKTDPTSRRLLLTDYNPLQCEQGVLFPCHSIICQFYVSSDNHLDMKVFNRSSDLFLGLPFNITSSSLFLILIARVCQLKPRNLFINLGDAHIYEQHLQAVNTQLDRFPYSFPKIFINKDIKNLNDLESLSFDDFEIKNYKHNEKIKAQMIA